MVSLMDSLSVSGGGVLRNFRFSPGASLSVSSFATSTCRPLHRRRLHGGVAFWSSMPSWPSLWAWPCVQRPLVVFRASGVACERAGRGPVGQPCAGPGASPAVLEKTSAALKNAPFHRSCKYTKPQRHMTPESAHRGCARMRPAALPECAPRRATRSAPETAILRYWKPRKIALPEA